jgi:hypothetical protein
MHFKKQSASGMCIKKPPAAKRTVTFRNAVRRSVGPSLTWHFLLVMGITHHLLGLLISLNRCVCAYIGCCTHNRLDVNCVYRRCVGKTGILKKKKKTKFKFRAH